MARARQNGELTMSTGRTVELSGETAVCRPSTNTNPHHEDEAAV